MPSRCMDLQLCGQADHLIARGPDHIIARKFWYHIIAILLSDPWRVLQKLKLSDRSCQKLLTRIGKGTLRRPIETMRNEQIQTRDNQKLKQEYRVCFKLRLERKKLRNVRKFWEFLHRLSNHIIAKTCLFDPSERFEVAIMWLGLSKTFQPHNCKNLPFV